jgi:hypothetical protein
MVEALQCCGLHDEVHEELVGQECKHLQCMVAECNMEI